MMGAVRKKRVVAEALSACNAAVLALGREETVTVGNDDNDGTEELRAEKDVYVYQGAATRKVLFHRASESIWARPVSEIQVYGPGFCQSAAGLVDSGSEINLTERWLAGAAGWHIVVSSGWTLHNALSQENIVCLNVALVFADLQSHHYVFVQRSLGHDMILGQSWQAPSAFECLGEIVAVKQDGVSSPNGGADSFFPLRRVYRQRRKPLGNPVPINQLVSPSPTPDTTTNRSPAAVRTMDQPRKLSKRQRKAKELFRARKDAKKKKAAAGSEPPLGDAAEAEDAGAFPAREDDAAGELGGPMGRDREKAVPDERAGKKRKKSGTHELQLDTSGNPDDAVADSSKKRRRRDGAPQAEGQGREQAVAEEPKRRYIVFVGNLPYKATKKDVEEHFAAAGRVVSCRFLTDKNTGKSKGFAFVEFEDSASLNNALHFHHTLFLKRQINVELTAGGGGKSESRKAKIDEKRASLDKERRKYYESHVLANKGHGKGKSDANQPEKTQGDDREQKRKVLSEPRTLKKLTATKVKRPPRVEGANAVSLELANRRVFGNQAT